MFKEVLPEPRRADHRLHDAAHPGEHPLRGGAVVPRARRPAADALLGPACSPTRLASSTSPGGSCCLPGPLPGADDAGLQPARRRSARRARPEEQPIAAQPDNALTARNFVGRPTSTHEKRSLRPADAADSLKDDERGGPCDVARLRYSFWRWRVPRRSPRAAAATAAGRRTGAAPSDTTEGPTPTAGGTFRDRDGRVRLHRATSTRRASTSATFWGIYSNLLGRTLVGYNHQPERRATSHSRPRATDPASLGRTARPTPSRSRTASSSARRVSREITSEDVVYAFERIGTPSLVAQYGFYYAVSRASRSSASRARPSDDLRHQTPDDKTIVFNLTQPTGDFLYRLAMPAAGPIPRRSRVLHQGRRVRPLRDLVGPVP